MRTLSKALLATEVVICFTPMAFALLWMCAVTATPFMMMLRGGGYEYLGEGVRGLLPFIAALMACSALFSMLRFIFGGVRPLSVITVAICSVVGLLSLAVAIVNDQTWDSEALSFLWAPFFCALHLLYLGRHYFYGANKTMEPTR